MAETSQHLSLDGGIERRRKDEGDKEGQQKDQQPPASCLTARTAPPKLNRSVRRSQIPKMDVCVESVVAKLAKSSRFLQEDELRDENSVEHTTDELPIFHRSEIKTSALLGTGAFSEVYQIHGFKPYATNSESGFDPVQERKRDDIITSSIDEHTGRCRFALKHLRPEFLNYKKKFQHAGADLVLEVRELVR